MTAAGSQLEATRPPKLRQLPGLDGLRAIAVVAVIIYHLNPSWLPGGFGGVDVFFVISGYLITSLLLSEYARSSGIALRRFWARRARRLLPALAAVLLGVTLLAAVFARDALGPMGADLPASVFYVLNWRLLFEHNNYVSSFGRPPLLQHLWSLSVEEQFYLLWPPALLLLRRRFSRSQIAVLALGGAVVSAALMAGLFRPGGDPSGVYFGTDTHAFGLLIGAALAAAVPPWRMTAAVVPSARRVLERCGAVALLVVIVGFIVLGFDSSLTYRGGMLLLDLATAVVIATVAHPASRLGEALSRQPLEWLGLRSYSLYLWHWPIFEMTRTGPDLGWSTGADLILRLGLTAAAAELTYRYVEQPWRDGRAQFALRVRVASLARSQVVAAAAAPLLLVTLILATAPGAAEPTVLGEGATAAARTLLSTSTVAPQPFPPIVPGDPAARVYKGHPSPATTVVTPVTVLTRPKLPPPLPGPVPATTKPILALGDSVLLAASPALSSTFGSAITIDADIGRQVDAGLARLAAYRASGALAHYRTVMVALGTNGEFDSAQFAQMVSILAGVAHVVVYDVHAARPWTAATNAILAQGVAAHAAQMHLADWNAAATPNLLYPDGVHPDLAGAATYAELLVQALSPRPVPGG
jgi:peptidoglycan/LPS O-acetylase OafA/YrhL